MASAPVTESSPSKSAIARIFESLKYRDFKLLWVGNLATQAGYWMFSVGQGWLMLQLTEENRALWLAVLGAVGGIPLLLFSLVGGVLADRFDRKRLLLIYQAVNLVSITVFAALVWFGWVQIWHVLAIAFIFGTSQSLNIPLRQSLVPSLVAREDLLNATALTSAAWNAMRVVGPSLAGIIIATVDTKGIFVIMVPAYIWAMIWVFQMNIPAKLVVRHVHPVRNLFDGLQFIRRDKVILSLIFTITIPTLFALPYLQFVPLFASDILQVGPQGLGFMEGAVGLGALIAALGVAGLGQIRHKGLLMIIVMTAYSALVGLFGISPNFVLSLVLLWFSGIAWSILNALNSTLLQYATPDEYRGRVFSVYALTFGFQPIGNLLIGMIANGVGPREAVFIGGMLGVLGTLALAWINPRLRKTD